MGLSKPVEIAVEEAVKTTESLVKRILDGEPISGEPDQKLREEEN
jgi:hypothetical protein